MIMARSASTSDTENPPLPTPLTDAPRLVASDIDGTLLVTGQLPAVSVIEAVAAVRDAGHHFALATGRSLSGALTAARELGLTDGWLVASNGAVTARLAGGSYTVLETRDVDAEAAIRLATRIRPDMRIAVEIVGIGYHVSEHFPVRALNGDQVKVGRLSDLWVGPTPRVVVYGQDAQRLVPALRAAGLTAIATRVDWVDITVGSVSKATAVERLRRDLNIPAERTVSIGDAENDIELLQWAWRGVAMGHATAQVQDAADEVTGTVGEDGAAAVLDALRSAAMP
ncbi:HAD family hydrolase [Promicromonospora sp. NPDC023805]|uniref:HAD family hydrolase n=1 Tax=Promicromonospora sp. NPDC023805 TaxID=3154696 RepID=UPI0033C041AB